MQFLIIVNTLGEFLISLAEICSIEIDLSLWKTDHISLYGWYFVSFHVKVSEFGNKNDNT